MATRNFINVTVLPKVTYYLLRAYDLGAPVKTPVFWVTREVSYNLAPTPQYGPYGPIVVMDVWRV